VFGRDDERELRLSIYEVACLAMSAPVLRTTRFEDRGMGPGGSDYLGWDHVLHVGPRAYGLRQYAGEGVMNVTGNGVDGTERIRGGVPYNDPEFALAARWLLQLPGVNQLTVLTSDPEFPDDAYVPVDPGRLVGEDTSPYVI
jgi:hypothetical protein